MIELRSITKDNFDDCLRLRVAENQAKFVAPNIYSLAQAWVYYHTAFPFAIYADNIMVGFIMMGYYEIGKHYNIWRFMVDERYQNKGYGRNALILAIKYLVDKFNVKELFLSVEPENHTAHKLYKALGFVETGDFSGDEIVMRLMINDDSINI